MSALNPTAALFVPHAAVRSSSGLPLPLERQDESSSGPCASKRRTPVPPKPVLCRFFRTPNGCPSGQACRFVHEEVGSVGPLEPGKHARLKREKQAAREGELKRRAVERAIDKRSLMSCKLWLHGFCHRGASCVYAHAVNPPTMDEVISRSDAGSAASPFRFVSTANHQREDASSEGSGSESGENACGVCFEVPQFYGLLEGCSHVFCLPCITSWRATSSKTGPDEGSNAKKCPLCRERSHFITPSSRFFPAGDEKRAVVATYKESMAKKECKYFKESFVKDPDGLPSCPFHNNCFYSHAKPFPSGRPYLFPDRPAGSRSHRRSSSPWATGDAHTAAIAALLRVVVPPAAAALDPASVSVVAEAERLFDEADTLSLLGEGIRARQLLRRAVAMLAGRLEDRNNRLPTLALEDWESDDFF